MTPGATLTVSSGQTSASLTVLSGGTLDVLSGGVATGAMILRTETLLGGTDSLGVVRSDGVQIVSSGGLVVSGIAYSGATQTVLAGGLVSASLVMDGLSVLPGGLVSDSVLDSSQVLVSGGLVISARLGTDGEMMVTGSGSAGAGVAGEALGTVVSIGGVLVVTSGGFTSGTELLSGLGSRFSGGAQEEVVGGLATATTISGGAIQSIGSITTSNGRVVNVVTGSAAGAVVLSGGVQDIYAGTVLNDVVSSGGFVSDDGTLAFTEAAGATMSFAGTLYTAGYPSPPGSVVESGPGTIALAGDLSGFTGSVVISGGTLELTSGGAAGGGSIVFAPGATGSLQIDGGTGPANTISGFAAGDIIDLVGLTYAGATSPTVNGNSVTVGEGGLRETLHAGGGPAAVGVAVRSLVRRLRGHCPFARVIVARLPAYGAALIRPPTDMGRLVGSATY